jgi:alpha-tubulin suppressor-like RCC1 family protein
MALMILASRKECDLNLRDHEGISPLELLHSTISRTSSLNPGQIIGESKQTYCKPPVSLEEDEDDTEEETDETTFDPAVSVFTWVCFLSNSKGKNSNYILGHDSADDRSRPEQVVYSTSSNQPIMNQVAFSKYHTAALSSDGDIYVNGFGRNGRLGLGDDETILKPAKVEGIGEEIIDVVLGPDHSLAIGASGSLYSWGSNKNGQLGIFALGLFHTRICLR